MKDEQQFKIWVYGQKNNNPHEGMWFWQDYTENFKDALILASRLVEFNGFPENHVKITDKNNKFII